jgi:hypothetical protein
MKKLSGKTALVALVLFAISSCNKDDKNQNTPTNEGIEVTLAAGDSSAVISKIESFRHHAGNPINTVSSADTGRREINWDGVPADFINNNTFPANFFNPIEASAPDGRKRGLVYIPANALLRVSDNSFSDVDSSNSSQFKTFSKNKLFSPAGTNITELQFKVPGTDKAAYVKSFGVVFVDVDNPYATIVEAYEGSMLVAVAKAMPSDKNFSFTGLHSHEFKITRIRITSGNAFLNSRIPDNDTNDIVVMDDLIYSEPKAL